MNYLKSTLNLKQKKKLIRQMSEQDQKNFVAHYREHFTSIQKGNYFSQRILVVIEEKEIQRIYLIPKNQKILVLQNRLHSDFSKSFAYKEKQSSESKVLYLMPNHSILHQSTSVVEAHTSHNQNGILFLAYLKMSTFG